MTRDDVEVSIPNAVIGTAKIINESGGALDPAQQFDFDGIVSEAPDPHAG